MGDELKFHYIPLCTDGEWSIDQIVSGANIEPVTFIKTDPTPAPTRVPVTHPVPTVAKRPDPKSSAVMQGFSMKF